MRTRGIYAGVTLIPGNYVSDGLIDLLRSNGFEFDVPTYIIWEGNVMYMFFFTVLYLVQLRIVRPLEYITNGCLDTFSDEEIDLMVAMTTTARRPLNWNLLTVDSRTPEKTTRQLEASSRAAAAGGRIVALTMPTLVPMNMSFRTHCALFLIPGWGDVMGLPVEQRIEKLSDPEVRRQLDELAHSEAAGVFRRLSHWANYIIGDTFAPENQGLSWRDVGSIAEEQGKPPFDALLDLVIADELRTVLWPKASDGDDASWQARTRGVGRPRGHGRGFGRRRPPRPHVRVQLPDLVPGGLPPEAEVGSPRAGHPVHDR